MLNYQNRQNNQATFETLAEVCAHAPEATQGLFGTGKMKRVAHPVLLGFPDDLIYVYRSAGLYGGETAARLNTTLLVFADRRFGGKEEGLVWLKETGLTELIDECIGSVILVTPLSDEGYGEKDLKYTYDLVNVLFSPRAYIEIDGERCFPAENEYCGGYGKNYVFGAGKGATFMYNYVAGSRDELSCRITGFFAFGGEMDEGAAVSTYIPAFLVNAPAGAVEKFRIANGCNTYAVKDGISSFKNQQIPLREVRVSDDRGNKPGYWMVRAYKEMFMFLQRTSNLITPHPEPSAANPYRAFVPAPPVTRYVLSARNPVINDRTVIGDLQVTFVHDPEAFKDLCVDSGTVDEKFINFKTDENDYLDTWYEILPQNVLNNTAPEHSVPLVMANHGGGDDILMYIDETNILLTAGKQQFAVCGAMHSGLTFVGGLAFVGEAITRLVKYLLAKYPALDPERVYVTGYSMGGAASYSCISTHPEVFAAAVPMAMPLFGIPEQTDEIYKNYEMPAMLMSSTYDFAAWDPKVNHLGEGAQFFFSTFGDYNGIRLNETFDFEKYPFIGQPTDSMEVTTENGEWRNFHWKFFGKKGFSMMELNVTENVMHSLWPGYADIMWDFMKHYRRDSRTGEVIYTE